MSSSSSFALRDVLVVVTSIAALALGPLALRLGRTFPFLWGALDAFVLVSLCGVVFGHVLPQSLALAGAAAVGAAVAGLLLPALLHRFESSALSTTGVLARAVALAGLAAHAILDGVALVQGEGDVLAIAVILHRVPVGLALAWIVLPAIGLRGTLVVAAVYAGGTLLGAFAVPMVFTGGALPESAAIPSALLQAFVAGSVLHVATERPPFLAAGAVRGAGPLLGAIAAVVLTLGVDVHEHHDDAGPSPLLHVVGALAPSFLLALLCTAVARAIADRTPAGDGGGARFVRALLLPVRACDVVVGADRMAALGAPPAAQAAFVFPALAAGVVALVPALVVGGGFAGGVFAALRVAIIVVGTAAAALLLPTRKNGGFAWREPDFRAWHFLDHLAPWWVVGFGVAALVDPLLTSNALAVPSLFAPVVGALVAAPLYLCPLGALPLAWTAVHKGFSLGGALAFVVVGPLCSVSLWGLLRRRWGAAGGRALVAVVVTGVAGGMTLDALLPAALAQVDDATLAPPMVQLGCAAVLVVVTLVSLWRQGVRGFLHVVTSPLSHPHVGAGEHVHSPGCDHGCGHDHTPGAHEKKPVARVPLSFDPR